MPKKKIVKKKKAEQPTPDGPTPEAPTPVTQPPETQTFEASLAGLQQIVEQLEAGDLGLADSLTHYEQAVAHLKRCHTALEHAEGRIELLSGVDAEGNPIARPFKDPSTGDESLEAKASARAERRSAGVDDPNQLF